MKFLHFADLHLDMPFNSSGLTVQKAHLRRKDLMDTFFRIIEIANAEKVDAILICGDLFEHDYVKKSTISLVNDAFMGIPHIKVFIVPGNHDPYIPNSFYSNFMWSRNVNIFTKDLKYFTIPEQDACLYGVGFGNFYEEKSLIFDLGNVDPSKINIFMTHGTVDMNFGKSMYNPMSGIELAGLGMDYTAIGHFHKKFESYGNIYNPGSPEPLGFDEISEHGVFVVEIIKNKGSEKKLDVKFIETGIKTYETYTVSIDGCENDRQAYEKIMQGISTMKAENKLLRITLKGYLPRGNTIDPGRIKNILSEDFFHVKLIDETQDALNFGELASEYGLKGAFARKMIKKIEAAGDENERRLLLKALHFGLEALETGNISIIGE